MDIRVLVSLLGVLLVGGSCGNPTSAAPGPTNVKYNEGSVSDPILLTVETPRQCKLGKFQNDETHSYYKFTVPANGTYYIKASNFSPSSVTKFSPNVYSSADYAGLASFTSVGNYTTALECAGLTAGVVYYLELMNMYDSNDNITYDLVISTTN